MLRSKTETKDKVELLRKLPQQQEDREQLKEAIMKCAKRLSKANEKIQDAELGEKIQILNTRAMLIDGCSDMSLLRLNHLEEIFKHYCTHIFKIGKHMTFDRLEYEKVHLTMERFFLFLKDFQLTVMRGTEKKEEVIEKNAIITIFKKISSTCRDLSFPEFIQCIEKLAILYYDEKQVFYEKKEKLKEEKDKRKQEYEKKKKMKLKMRAYDKGEEIDDDEDGDQSDEDGIEGSGDEKVDQEKKNAEKPEEQEEVEHNNENDDLVNDMINDKDLEDPNEQINKITNRYALEQAEEDDEASENESQRQPNKEEKPNKFDGISDEQLMIMTNEEKIEYYYQYMIKVDNVTDYREKLTTLNLPIFQKRIKQRKTIDYSESTIRKATQEESARIEKLKQKMNEKKMKQKASPIPKPKNDDVWNKAEEEKRRKRELKKEREEQAKVKNKKESDALAQKKIDSQKEKAVKQKKAEFNEKAVDWQSLGKISIDQLKLKQFNPNRYFSKDDDDKTFLDEYEGGSRPRIASGMAMRERNSLALVNDMKKRVGQMQKKEQREHRNLETLSKKMRQNIPMNGRF